MRKADTSAAILGTDACGTACLEADSAAFEAFAGLGSFVCLGCFAALLSLPLCERPFFDAIVLHSKRCANSILATVAQAIKSQRKC
jgi:hypothetical protein